MKFPSVSLLWIFIILIAALVCFTSIYSLNSYSSPPCSISDPSPVSLSIPAGNCTCTVSYVSAGTHQSIVPSFSCNCQNSTADLHLQGHDRFNYSTELALKCPVCPAPELQIVEKEELQEVGRACPNAPWYVEGKEWHFPARYPLCSMDSCFNYSRCENMEELMVYTYDLPSPPVRYFSRMKESKYHTDNPEKACLFLVFLDTQSPWPPLPNTLPHWNGGQNHVLVTFADRWELKGPPPDSIGLASIMGTIVYETTYRAGFDVSIPLPGNNHVTELQSLKPLQRKYFATFRGTRYLGDRGDGVFRSQDSFRGIHNGKDIVVATSCNHAINNMIRQAHPHLGIGCDEDEILYASYDFKDLMNTTFGLVPAGRQPASYRFIEVLSAGAIPVLIADNYVKPFDTLIQWHKCLLQFPTSQMQRIVATLRSLKEQEILTRQENCLHYYNEFLKDNELLVQTAMRAMKQRFLGAISNFAEIKRR